ncbi:MAG: hypothetical protein ACI9VS_003367 [Candidatus Binatia bacterium]|jgi:hypothetical protein
MDNLKELAESIYRRKVLRAREAPADCKMKWGGELFAGACGRMRDGIRHQFPDANEPEVERILRARLQRLRQVHEHGVYKTDDGRAMTDGNEVTAKVVEAFIPKTFGT